MDAREEILAKIGKSAGTSQLIDPPTFTISNPTWERFEKELVALGGKVSTLDQLDLTGTIFIDPTLEIEIPKTTTKTDDVWSADYGFSHAECAIAETGSLVVKAGAGVHRLSSLAPPRNIVFVKRDHLVASIEEALPYTSGGSSAIITGPSRTSDIEGTLVKGIHGPRELTVVILD